MEVKTMGKGRKIVVFIIVVFIILLVGALMKEAGARGVAAPAAIIAIRTLYQAMFKKRKPEENPSENKEIREIRLKK